MKAITVPIFNENLLTTKPIFKIRGVKYTPAPREKFLDGIQKGLVEAIKINKGEMPGIPAEEFLNEL